MYGNILNVHSNIVNAHRRIVNVHGNIVNAHRRIANVYGNIVNVHRRIVNVHGNILNVHRRIAKCIGEFYLPILDFSPIAYAIFILTTKLRKVSDFEVVIFSL